ncbi:MAG: potassium channel protein [Dehalococcoidia bacterium]|nr:potassium channel protein [Dehalococcoidia bacterium]
MRPAGPRPGPVTRDEPRGIPGLQAITRVRGLRRGKRSQVWRRIQREWRQAGVRAAVFAAVITLVSADLMFMLEHRDNPQYGTPWDALWWSMATMTTTGYGDVVPHLFLGRALGVFTMVSGMGLFSVLTALIASSFVTESFKEARGLEAIKESGHIIVAGWNWGGERVMDGLLDPEAANPTRIVLVNQLAEEAVAEVLFKYRDWEMKFVRGDFTHEAVLQRANIAGARAAVILADSSSPTTARADDRTILACLAMKHLSPDLKVTGELLESTNVAHLHRAGADDVVLSGEFNSFLLASAAHSPGVPDAVRAMLSLGGPAQLRKLAVPERFRQWTFGEFAAYLREHYRVLTVGVVTESQGLTLASILSANQTSVDEFIQRKFEEAGISFDSVALSGVQVNPDDSYVLGPNDSVVIIGEGAAL